VEERYGLGKQQLLQRLQGDHWYVEYERDPARQGFALTPLSLHSMNEHSLYLAAPQAPT
jgi:hypothetical protein